MSKDKNTSSDQAKINKAIQDYQKKAKEAEMAAKIQNAILDEQRKQPGYTGY